MPGESTGGGTRARWAVATAITAALGATVALILVAALGGPSGTVSHVAASGFPALKPGPAPPGWHSASLPGGQGVLAYPPSMVRIGGDRGTVSAARYSRTRGYLLYLNATPRQGAESLRDFPRYRLRLLRGDDARSARELASAKGIAFRGGTGSCVMDSYITRIGGYRYDEIACFVRGRLSSSVVVGAAAASQWPESAPSLERAVAAYRVR